MRQHSEIRRVGRVVSMPCRVGICSGVVVDNNRKSSGWMWYRGECNASPVSEILTSSAIPVPESFLNTRCSKGDEWIALILAAVLTGKSISW